MDDTLCDVNHLDADVLLPPRKRFLAGLKKQSLSSNLSLPSCSSSWPSSVCKAHLNSLMSAHANSSSLMLKEIAEASESSAVTAADIAKAARAAAEEKAAVAARKFAAAKSALDLVASFSEEGINDGSHFKRSKLKKQVPVCSLYRGIPRKVTSSKTDEDIARKLHRVMNGSSRILKSPSTTSSNSKYTQDKIHDVPHNSLGNGFVQGGSMVLETSRIGCNGHAIAGEVESDGYTQATRDNDEKAYDKSRNRKLQVEQDKVLDEKHMTTGKKRGRVKLRRLPLSICTHKDGTNLMEDGFSENVSVPELENANGVRGCACFVDSSGDGTKKAVEVKKRIDSTRTPFWICQVSV